MTTPATRDSVAAAVEEGPKRIVPIKLMTEERTALGPAVKDPLNDERPLMVSAPARVELDEIRAFDPGKRELYGASSEL